MSEIECVVRTPALLGEGAVWSASGQVLYWVDITGRRLHRYDPARGADEEWEVPEEIGAVAPRRGGGLVAAMRSGFFLLDILPALSLRPLGNPEPRKPGNRMNDGACDRAGRFWAGTMVAAPGPRGPEGTLYRLDADHSVHAWFDGFRVFNGLAFSPDGGTMYFSDTDNQVCAIWACDYVTDAGTPRNRRLFAATRDLGIRPDGAAMDADGCYWTAASGAWKLARFTPAGRLDRVIDLPVEKPTKIAFGGPRLDVMYVTSISYSITPGTEARQPFAGGLLAVRAGVTGLAEAPFEG